MFCDESRRGMLRTARTFPALLGLDRGSPPNSTLCICDVYIYAYIYIYIYVSYLHIKHMYTYIYIYTNVHMSLSEPRFRLSQNPSNL